MPTITAQTDSPRAIEDVFDYLADFSTTAEWDPGIASAERLDDGPIGVGSRFRLLAAVGKRRVPMEYAITAYDRPRSVTIEGGTSLIRSVDVITVAARGDRTVVTYTATLTLGGWLRPFTPLAGPVFSRIAAKAIDGLRTKLS